MKKLIKSIFVGGMLMGSVSVYAELDANIAVTSDYMWRGISQSAGDPAIQGGLDYAHKSGFYVGVWGSNVDWWEPEDAPLTDNGEDIEIDVYAGYQGLVTSLGLVYDVGLLQYIYPGTTTTDSDFTEVYIGASFNVIGADINAKYSYSDDFANLGNSAWYLDMGIAIPFPGDFVTAFHIGWSDGKHFYPTGIEYFDLSLGISKEISGFNLGLAYHDSDNDGVQKDRAGALQNDGVFVFTVSRDFNLL